MMRPIEPTLIFDANLSLAWAKAFLHTLNGGESECLMVCIRGFRDSLPPEDAQIREALAVQIEKANQELEGKGKSIPTIGQTALTLVPYERWIREGKPPVTQLSKWYLDAYLPRLKARCHKNRRGTYFERMVAFTGVRTRKGKQELHSVNQLASIIRYWKKAVKTGKRPRQSALQAACFDPAKDHTGSALLGFPCLQQVSFTYKESGTLELNAYYPTQYLFDRGYGNYLGLCQLGHIIAHELGVHFTGLTVFVARPEVGWGNKTLHADVIQKLQQRVKALSMQGVHEASIPPHPRSWSEQQLLTNTHSC